MRFSDMLPQIIKIPKKQITVPAPHVTVIFFIMDPFLSLPAPHVQELQRYFAIWPDKILIKIVGAVITTTISWQLLLFIVQGRKVEARDNLNDLKTKFTPMMKHCMEAIVISEVLSAVFTGTALA